MACCRHATRTLNSPRSIFSRTHVPCAGGLFNILFIEMGITRGNCRLLLSYSRYTFDARWYGTTMNDHIIALDVSGEYHLRHRTQVRVFGLTTPGVGAPSTITFYLAITAHSLPLRIPPEPRRRVCSRNTSRCPSPSSPSSPPSLSSFRLATQAGPRC